MQDQPLLLLPTDEEDLRLYCYRTALLALQSAADIIPHRKPHILR